MHKYLEGISNMRDTDFPFFHNLFHGSNTLKPEPIGVNNGLIFPLGPSPSPSKVLFQNPFPNFETNPQSLPLNGSNLNSQKTTSLGLFTTEGHVGSSTPPPPPSNSSPIPLLGLSNTTNIGVSSNGHLNNINNNNNIAFNSLPLAPPSQNGILHGLPSIKPFWDNQNNLIQGSPQPVSQTFTYSSSNLINFKDLGSSTKSYTNNILSDDHDVSCIATPDQKAGHQKRIAGQKKRRRILMRKASKAQKKGNVVKGQWTPQEDRVLIQLVGRYGVRKWSKIAKALTGRVGKQCRERWHNHLRPDIRKDTWSEEEDKILIRAHRAVGNKWAEIARRLPGRSENTIKNHWNATKRRQNSKNSNKKNNKEQNCQSSLLQDYIRSLMNLPPDNNNDNKDDVVVLDLVQNDDDTTSSQAATAADVVNTTLVGTDNNSLTDPADVACVDNWVVNPAVNLVYHNNNSNLITLDLENDKNLYSDSYGFRSFLDEMAAMENESNVDFQMRTEIESLMKGPGDVKKEMDLMEMICQGKL